MYGPYFGVKAGEISLTLRPFCKNDLQCVAEGFSRLDVHMFTNTLFAQVYDNELEWFDRTRKSEDVVSWAIVPNGLDYPIGITALHDIRSFDGVCSSGIVIWNRNWWGRGVASAAHLVRTRFAADFLTRVIIKSCVRSDNIASIKALQKVGYSIWGSEPLSGYKDAYWMETHHLKWFHPDRTQYLFPRGVPEKFKLGIKKAEEALTLSRSVVTIL